MEAFDELAQFGPEDSDSIFRSPKDAPARPVIKPANSSTVTTLLAIRPTSNFMEIWDSEDETEWVIEGLLPTEGLMYVGARSGTGKTILVLQIVVDMIFNRDTMTFKRSKNLPPQKILILSLEMGKRELTARLRSMYPEIPEEDRKILADSIEFYHNPEPFRLWTPDHVAELIMMIRKHHVTGVVIDSASVSFAQSLKDDSQVNDTITNLYMIRNRLMVWMVVVSHTRKLPAGIVGNMEDITVDELFGHSGVGQSASSVLLMLHDKKSSEAKKSKDKLVWLMNVKSRFAAELPPFKMWLPPQPPILFRRSDPIALPPLTPEQRRKANKEAEKVSFADVFRDIDFGSIGGSEDD